MRSVCESYHKGWVCSLTPGHLGDHEAWASHEPTGDASDLCDRWPNPDGPVSAREVEEAINSIRNTRKARG